MCEYPRGLGRQASGCEFELETSGLLTTTEYLGVEMTTKRLISQRDGFIKHT